MVGLSAVSFAGLFLLTRFSLVTLYLFDVLRGFDNSFAWKLTESLLGNKFKEDLEN